MPASLIVIPQTIVEISEFLGQLPVDDDYDSTETETEYSLASLGTRDTHCADLARRTSVFAVRHASYFSNYIFYVPNLCVLGTRPVLLYKNGYFCKLELVRAKSVYFRYSCNFSGVGWSQVELSYQ